MIKIDVMLVSTPRAEHSLAVRRLGDLRHHGIGGAPGVIACSLPYFDFDCRVLQGLTFPALEENKASERWKRNSE